MGRKRDENDAAPNGGAEREPEDLPEDAVEIEDGEADPIEAITAERDDWKDRYHRALADAENARKRHQREKTETRQYAVTELARDLVNVIDNLDRALAGVPADQADDAIVTGVRLVHEQFLGTLKSHGVETIEAMGQPFDPISHEAIQQEERDDVAPGTIVEELMTGYRLADRLLRASVVKVARAPAAERAEEKAAEAPKKGEDEASEGPATADEE